MQEAADMILEVFPIFEDMVPATRETAHLLGLFRAMLEDPKALEDEAYFLEHGKPKGVDLSELFKETVGPEAPSTLFDDLIASAEKPEYDERPEFLDRDDLIAYTEQV